VEFRAAALRLSRARLARALARVVDDDHGEVEAALEATEKAEDRGDIARRVLVDAMEADKGIEDKQLRPQFVQGLGRPLAIIIEVETD
jgi:thioredoxin-like negative regulator of GroEL